jgi:hypothetical protein
MVLLVAHLWADLRRAVVRPSLIALKQVAPHIQSGTWGPSLEMQ